MADITRRSFLGGALAVAAVSIVPASMAAAGLPRIVGDGIHDDTAGLQAALDGEPFVCDGLVVCGANSVLLNRGVYRLTKTLMIDGPVEFGCGPEASPKILGYYRMPLQAEAMVPQLLIDHDDFGVRVRTTESGLLIKNLAIVAMPCVQGGDAVSSMGGCGMKRDGLALRWVELSFATPCEIKL